MNDPMKKIMPLMQAKDQMERAMHILRAEGYGPANRDYAALVAAINGIRADVFGLQTGQLPFMEAQHEKT